MKDTYLHAARQCLNVCRYATGADRLKLVHLAQGWMARARAVKQS